MQRCDEAAGLNKFCLHGTTTGKFTFSLLQFWPKEIYKTPGNLLKGLKPNPETSLALHWQCTFKPQLKSICKPSVEEVVITDTSKESYGGMNNISFRGRWPAKKGRDTHISILEKETMWMTCQKFEKVTRRKTISFWIGNAMVICYLLKEGGSHSKT